MKRATRVPASTVVRMNSASNMIAKWYQTASNVSPNALEKMLAMPTASEGAPPVRANSVASPISFASALHLLHRDREAPAEYRGNGVRGLRADDSGRAVDCEVHAWVQHARGDHRHDGDE